VLRRDFHDDAVLVELGVDRRYDRLPEREVQDGVDLALREPEPRRGRAIEDQRGLQPAHLLVGVDVGDLGHVAQRALEARHPGLQVGQFLGLQRELVARVAHAAADADVGCLVERHGCSRGVDGLRPQPRDDLLGADLALRKRLQCDEHRSAVALPAAGEHHDVVDRGVLLDHPREVGELGAHRLERNALVRAHEAEQAPGVLLREKAFRHHGVKIEVQRDRRREHHDDQQRVAQRPAERHAIATDERVVPPGAQPRPAAGRFFFGGSARRIRAHIIGVVVNEMTSETRIAIESVIENSRNRRPTMPPISRIGMNTAISDSVIESTVKPTSRDPASAASMRGMPASMRRWMFSRTTIASSTTNPGGDGQRHQRKVVDREAGDVHERERADERHRHGNRRDQRRAPAAQEQQHDEDHQAHRDRERALDFAQRRADGARALHHDLEVDRARDRGAQVRQQLGHAIDRLDDVRAGLAIEDQEHGRAAVRRSRVAHVLHRVDDLGDIRKAHGRAVAVRDDQWNVLCGLLRLVVRVDLPAQVALLDRALGTIRVRRVERGAHLVESDAVLVERGRIQLDAHLPAASCRRP
jgi:hypothetical protein